MAHPFGKKPSARIRKPCATLIAAKAQLNDFRERDQPLFTRWINGNFGVLLTEIRELNSKLFEAQQLVAEVEQEFILGGHRSIVTAYREVMRRRTQPEPEPTAEPIDDAEEDEEFRREFEEAFGKTADDFWERIGGDAYEQGQAHRREKAKAASSSTSPPQGTLPHARPPPPPGQSDRSHSQ